jgi:hypothetical protein
MPSCESAMLVVALLTIESSYNEEIERVHTGIPDTVQFWLPTDGPNWRIKTFAIDHDIHVYKLGADSSSSPLSPARAEENIRKSYGDVIERLEVICVPNSVEPPAIAKLVADANLPGELEVAEAGFAFLNPDRGRYKSQSRPR